MHGRPDGTARKRFNDNREHLIEGEDFFMLDPPDEIRSLGIERPQALKSPSEQIFQKKC